MATKESISDLTLHEWANIQNIATSNHHASSLRGIREAVQKHPNYQTLFAETERAGLIDHDSSALSPAAYFVDLMRLIKVRIKNVPAGLGLRERRSDLWDIDLDAKNTTTEVPYLEIVNDIMAKRLEADFDKDPWQLLATSIYPSNLPYNEPLEKIRANLKLINIDLSEIFELFNGGPAAIARETLGLSPEEFDLIVNARPGNDDLSKAYDVGESTELDLKLLPNLNGINEVPDTGKSEMIIAAFDGFLHFRIFDADGNQVVDKNAADLPDRADDIASLQSQLDSRFSFTRNYHSETIMQRSADLVDDIIWSVKNLTGYAIGPFVDDLRRLELLLAQSGLTEQQFNDLVHQGLELSADEIDVAGRPYEFTDVLAAVNLFINRCIATYIRDTLDLAEEDKAKIQFYLLMTRYRKLMLGAREGGSSGAIRDGRGALPAYSRQWRNIILDTLHRFVRLAKKLGYSFADLDWALTSTGAVELDESAIINLAKIERLRKRLDLPIDKLVCFWHDMKIGVSHSLFHRTFDNLLASLDVVVRSYDGSIADYGDYWDDDKNILWDVDDRTKAKNIKIRASLCASLGIDDDRLTAILRHLDIDSKQQLTVNLLTRLYRFSKLAKALDLSINESLLMLKLLDNKLETIDDLTNVLDFSAWLKETELTLYDFQYITTGKRDKRVDLGYERSDLLAMLKELAAGTQEWHIDKRTFVHDNIGPQKEKITPQESESIYEYYESHIGFVDEQGQFPYETFMKNMDEDFLRAVPVEEIAFVELPLIDEETSRSIFQELQRNELIDNSGFLATWSRSDLALDFLLEDDPARDDKIERVVQVLSGIQDKLDYIRATIKQRLSLQVSYEKRIGGGLAGLFAVDPALIRLVLVIVKELKGQPAYLDHLLAVRYFGPLSDSLSKALLNEEIQSGPVPLPLLISKTFAKQKIILSAKSTIAGLNGESRWKIADPEANRHYVLETGEEKIALYEFSEPFQEYEVPAVLNELIDTLGRFLWIVSRFKLSIEELHCAYNLNCTFRPEVSDPFSRGALNTLYTFKKLAQAWTDPDKTFCKLFVESQEDGLPEQFLKVAAWDEDQYRSLMEHTVKKEKGSLAFFASMKKYFEMSSAIGLDVASLLKLSALASLPSMRSATLPEQQKELWMQYSDGERSLASAIKGKFDAAQWETLSKPMGVRLNERARDVLASFMIWHLNRLDGFNFDAFGSIDSLEDLSNYLLIDVQMSGVVKISKIKQGLNTLQRFIQRYYMSLEEDGQVIVAIGDKEWSWRSHYRLWEANRKVFLYPENYLDPDLRKISTPLYKELQDELLQGDINDETVTKVYTSYFDKFDELASLKIVDQAALATKAARPGVPEGENTLFTVGKTDNDPPDYYYRSDICDDEWKVTARLPWQKVTLAIHSDQVCLAYANHRLYILWAEAATAIDREKEEQKKRTTTRATVKFSYRKVSGNWSSPQVFRDIEDFTIWESYEDKDGKLQENRFFEETGFPSTSPTARIKVTHEGNGTKHKAVIINRWGTSATSKLFVIESESLLAHEDITETVHKLREKLVGGGPKALLSFSSQGALASGQESSGKIDFDLSSSYAVYFRELFFHIPFLIADTLNRNQRFQEAQKWYHNIFNPLSQLDNDGQASANDDPTPFWRYQPFKEHTDNSLKKLAEIKKNFPQELKIYREDPFDAHAIAELRIGAYEKAIVMKYIDNLLDWGDQLFAQDNWESIVQAMMLYMMAQDLLGKKPKQAHLSNSLPDVKKFAEIDQKVDFADPFHVADMNYFPVAANSNFAGYWDRAADRLFKIRHSMNIKGRQRQLALFQPPIDPRQLMRALTAGLDLTDVANLLQAPVPHYRFNTMIQQAKNVTTSLTQLGSQLLSALEKKDAEQISRLRSTHEKIILNLTTRVKEKQIEDAGKNLESLNASLDSATSRRDHYRRLITQGLSPHEKTNLSLTAAALIAQDLAHGVRGGAIVAHLVPTIYGFSDGGMQPGSSVSEAAALSDAIAGIYIQQAGMAALLGQNERRKQDWELQEALANHDVIQIQAQIEGATIRQEIAQLDLEIHQKSIEQAGEMEDFLREKFTNQELYQWMVGRISSVYFQTYKIAFELAQAAEKAYHFERNTDETIITFGQWDNLKKGLLAGEGLMLGLHQLEKTYMDGNERTLEIEKTISLLQLAPEQLIALKKDGKCTFELSEQLFDYDFPGHYCRKIKSIAITIPAVVGPYQNVQATLRQISNRVLLQADPEGLQFLLPGKSNSAGAPSTVRSDWRRQQQIAISKGVRDSGLFELSFRDERYLPFEGTGAISTWQLSLPKGSNRSLDFTSISDVIVNLRYTALDGSMTFREQVLGPDYKQVYEGSHLFSLRQECSNEWQRFVAQDEDAAVTENGKPSLNFKLTADRLAINLQNLKQKGPATIFTLWTNKAKSAKSAEGEKRKVSLDLHKKGAGVDNHESGSKLLAQWKVTTGDRKTLAGIADIVLVVPYEGDLVWDKESGEL